METSYPWNGKIKLTVSPPRKNRFAVHLRIPGWLKQPVPGDLYRYETADTNTPAIHINGEPAAYKTINGYAVLERVWKKGDIITMDLPMKVKRIISHPSVKQNKDRVALQYGPLVYCIEGVSGDYTSDRVIIPSGTSFDIKFEPSLLGGVNVLHFDAPVVAVDGNGLSVSTDRKTITAIPYYTWNNRGARDMQVWLPSKIRQISINE